uniref:Serotriflin-like n=1 Tax=Gadus morhua TaxID=8049 RepID=A0A8C5FJY5_GADMO
MKIYTFAFLCACGLLALQVPSTTAVAATTSEQEEIVEKHNALRRGVQPTASNMLKMTWSSEAAANAQQWADTCSMKHSTAAFRRISTGDCGENLATASYKNSWTNSIQAWYNEVQDWKYGVGSYNGRPVGHYTQVVWYRSNVIGCGMAYCPNSETYYKYFFVCQYCPAGNYGFAVPYNSGPTCGDCPNDCDDKLCTNPCPHTDQYSNCAYLAQQWGCGHTQVASSCPATCKCANLIK